MTLCRLFLAFLMLAALACTKNRKYAALLTNASVLKNLQDLEIKIENYAIDVIKESEKALNELFDEPH